MSSVRVSTAGASKRIERELKKRLNKKRSQAASAINKEIRAGRKEIVESMMVKTGLKRKVFNDRLAITRANPKGKIEGRLTPIFGRRLYMNMYPFSITTARGGKKVIRLTSPIYRKNMRTGFMSADKSRMYLRSDDKGPGGESRSYVRAVRGRSVPRLFDEFKMKEKHEGKIIDRVLKAVKGVLGL